VDCKKTKSQKLHKKKKQTKPSSCIKTKPATQVGLLDAARKSWYLPLNLRVFGFKSKISFNPDNP